MMKNLAKEYNIELKFSPAYFHSHSGLAEVGIKNLQQILKFYFQEYLNSWPEKVALAVFAYNTSIQTNLKESPHFLLMDYIPRYYADC